MKVHPETLTTDEHGSGTIEITIGKDRRAVGCFRQGDHVSIYGLAVRYPTGAKVWRGRALYSLEKDSVFSLRSSGMDRRTRHNSVSLVGFYEDAGETVRSRHAGN